MSDRTPRPRRTPGRTRLPSTETLDKERRALEMRRARATYTDIARALGYNSPSGAWEAVHRAIGRHTQGNVEQLRREELDMLDRLHLAHWPAAVGNPPDPKAAAVILSIGERRAKLLGLNAAEAYKVTVSDSMDQEIQRLAEELAALGGT